MSKPVHIALDFDKTLAYHESEFGTGKPGRPIEPMVKLLRQWLSKGYKVTIFTARVSAEFDEEHRTRQIGMIEKFLYENDLPLLDITANKSTTFSHIIDDRAYKVSPNTGSIFGLWGI